ncbi:hypothetical protein IUK39_01200 [Priestia aryabhattai]|nr:hypothetical protein [Priestia aryabhattai]MBU3568801.1 hypothetical protein [Priestia aryabhattai]
MAWLCEVCGKVEEMELEKMEGESPSQEISMGTLHICESCIEDRQHPVF